MTTFVALRANVVEGAAALEDEFVAAWAGELQPEWVAREGPGAAGSFAPSSIPGRWARSRIDMTRSTKSTRSTNTSKRGAS